MSTYFILSTQPAVFELVTLIVPSSANLKMEMSSLRFNSDAKSITYILKSIGDNADPWGSPMSKQDLFSPMIPFVLSTISLFMGKSFSKCMIFPWIPIL